MQTEEKIKMLRDVFAPKSGDEILFLIDTPHDDLKDNNKWIDRRKMTREWYDTFQEIGNKEGFSVSLMRSSISDSRQLPASWG